LEGGGARCSGETGGQRGCERDGGERAADRAARTEEAGEPATGDWSAAFHQVLGLEVRAGVAFAAGAVSDRKVAILPRGLESAELRVEPEGAVERDGIGCLHGEAGAESVVVVVGDGRDQGEPVGRAAKEHYDEGARVVALFG